MTFFTRLAADLDPQVIILSLMTLVIMLGSSVIAPVLPLIAQEFGVSYVGAGALVAAFALGRIPFDFIGGAAVDRFSPRVIACGGAAIVAVSAALSAIAKSFAALLWYRLLGGIGSALFTITAMTFLAFTEFHRSVNFRNDSRIFRAARFKELGHTRKTTGDILGFHNFSRRFTDQITRMHFFTVIDEDNAANNQTYRIAKVLGGKWDEHYEVEIDGRYFPTMLRWSVNTKEWIINSYRPGDWIVWDGTPDGRPRRPEELAKDRYAEAKCAGCHTTGFDFKKDGIT